VRKPEIPTGEKSTEAHLMSLLSIDGVTGQEKAIAAAVSAAPKKVGVPASAIRTRCRALGVAVVLGALAHTTAGIARAQERCPAQDRRQVDLSGGQCRALPEPLVDGHRDAGIPAMRPVPIKGLLGTHALRGAYNTGSTTDLRDIPALLPPGDPAEPIGTKQGSYYVSYTFTQNLVQRVPTQPMTQSWGLFGQFGFSDSNPTPVAAHGYLGFGGSSLLANRPIDRFGVAFFWLAFSDELRGPLNEILGAGLRTERGAELFYNYAVRPWLRLTPDVQIVRQGLPGRTAVVGAVRAEVRF